MRLIFALALATAPALPATAGYWNYNDWHVSTDQIDTGEDLRVTCYAHTGGDGDPVWALEVSNGDAGPPDFFPAPRLIEIAPRHHQTVMYDQQAIEFKFDSGTNVAGQAMAYVNDEGFFQAESSPQQNSVLLMLMAMRRGSTVEAHADNKIIASASLDGFTAAYGKMMDECGFSLTMN
ncbi:hypothetical protein [Parasedimentitalea psychrophila]|uniref:Uncharacterized protein n=1 Tax=Parasedimentitalea psychrophila TaxID=2997337 RepID=A0A9Y2P0V8_9RHOB|nr:hypothetical protein [Parasedimentitalea psychrophila]WIY23537.1 hypothetical protein QPJ95_12800 [Parasedimentitalea psychrophila]